MIKRLVVLCFLFLSVSQIHSMAQETESYLSNTLMVVPFTQKQETPQAPRVSPDGKKLMYELYTTRKCGIWICDPEGKNKQPITQEFQTAGKLGPRIENVFWHPSQKYISFNESPEGNLKKGFVYVANFADYKISDFVKIDRGARPQFSKPNGNVLFYEATVEKPQENDSGSLVVNTLKYRILGSNPLKPLGATSIELRGPIQQVIYNVELSHPSLAPDGTTILFAARTSSTTGEVLKNFNITDGDRQRAVALWKEIVTQNIDEEVLRQELNQCLKTDQVGLDTTTLFAEDTDFLTGLKKNIDKLRNQPTIVKSFNRRDFVICWMMKLLTKLYLTNESEIEQTVYSRIWVTDVFGAPIEPLVDESSYIPLPQKWATVSKSGRFAVFEAGHYQNRHLYFVNLKTRKAIKLTEIGTYNSSPEISPDEQWIYFESNRSGKPGIWKAQLNLEQLLDETSTMENTSSENE